MSTYRSSDATLIGDPWKIRHNHNDLGYQCIRVIFLFRLSRFISISWHFRVLRAQTVYIGRKTIINLLHNNVKFIAKTKIGPRTSLYSLRRLTNLLLSYVCFILCLMDILNRAHSSEFIVHGSSLWDSIQGLFSICSFGSNSVEVFVLNLIFNFKEKWLWKNPHVNFS